MTRNICDLQSHTSEQRLSLGQKVECCMRLKSTSFIRYKYDLIKLNTSKKDDKKVHHNANCGSLSVVEFH